MYSKFNLSTFFLLIFQHIYAQPQTIDLRTSMQGDRNYIGIAARDNTPLSHAFVLFCKVNEKNEISELSIQGFYSKHDATPFDEGQIRDDFNSYKYVKSENQQLYFVVDNKEYEAAVVNVSNWVSQPPKYNMVTNNCIDFTKVVGQSFGIVFPTRVTHPGSVRPAQYIQLLKKELASQEGVSYTMGNRIKTAGLSQTYIGKLKEGKPDGEGRIANGLNLCIGTFKKGLKNGKFTTIDKFGNKKVQNYKDGIAVGPETTYFPNGDIGEVIRKDDEIISTTTTYKDGTKYTRMFDANGNESTIYFSPKDGLKFNGKSYDVSDSKYPPNSYGFQSGHLETPTYTFDGDFWFTGNNSFQKGKMTFISGDWYEGSLKNGKYDGRGHLVHTAKKDCLIMGLFCQTEGKSFDIVDDFTNGTSPYLQGMGINPDPSKSFPDPSDFKVPIDNPTQSPTDSPNNTGSSQGQTTEITNNIDPVPATHPSRPEGFTKKNSYWDPIRKKWRLL